MNILITGGAGFIGSHLCDRLVAVPGNKITVADNLIRGTRENIAHLMAHPAFEFVELNILDHERTDALFSRGNFGMVYHLAANSDIQKGGEDPSIDHDLTFETTFEVLRCMKQHKVAKLFFASTSAIYGETSAILTEDHGPLSPVSNYGAAKLASEAFISAFSANCDIQTWIARFPNVVGERFTHGAIFDFVNKLRRDPGKLVVLGNGEQNKPYMYVKDLVDGIIFLCANTSGRYNVCNLGVTSRTKVKEIAAMVIEEMGLCARIEYTGGDRGWKGDVPEFNYSIDRITALGWTAPHSSNESVRIAIQRALGK